MSFLIGDNKNQNKQKYPDIGQNQDLGQKFTNQFSQQSGWGQTVNYNQSQQPQSNWQQQKPQQNSNWGNQINKGISNFGQNFQNQNQPQNNYSAWDNANTNQNINQNNSGSHNIVSPMNNINTNSFNMNSIFNKPPVKYTFPSPFIKYKLIPVLDEKKALDVCTTNNSDKNLKKNNLIIWDYHGGPNQQFYIKEQGHKKYYIINVSKGFTMQIPESSRKDGVQVLVNPRNDSQNEFWELCEAGSNSYCIKSFCGKVLDLSGQSTKNGTPVIQWKQNGGKNQKWKIVPS